LSIDTGHQSTAQTYCSQSLTDDRRSHFCAPCNWIRRRQFVSPTNCSCRASFLLINVNCSLFHIVVVDAPRIFSEDGLF